MAADRVPEEFDRPPTSVDDQATAVEEREREAALAAQRDRAARAPRLPDGVCANCLAELKAGQRFCDQDCRDDYEKRVAARRRNGS